MAPNRLAILIDGQNFQHAARSLGYDIDVRKLLAKFGERGSVVRSLFFAEPFEREDGSRPFLDWLAYNGFAVVGSRPIEDRDRRRAAAGFDRVAATHAMRLADVVDELILFSGDGDFCRLVDYLQRRGVRVTIVSSSRTKPPLVADDLRRKADTYIDFAELAIGLITDGLASVATDRRRGEAE